jgi:hypothetical protein
MKWTSVKDGLPELIVDEKFPNCFESKNVIVIDEDGNCYICRYQKFIESDGSIWVHWKENTSGCGCCCQDLNIIHWMPLPEPPKDEPTIAKCSSLANDDWRFFRMSKEE